ncbi:MAG: hypothetical protein HXY26_06480 [Hydrogenophilaceae bacterium]|nr:hypothetical protein [Hydrogenophilaceae bacterium]
MNKPLIGLSLMVLSSLAIANQPPQVDDRAQVRQQMLEKIRAIESHSHHSRIRILQEAERCVQAAKTPQDYRACEQMEQQSREQLREELRPRRQALRDEVRQLRQPAAQTIKP